MTAASNAISVQKASIPPEIVEKALAPLLEQWQKDFAEVLAKLLQDLNAKTQPDDGADAPPPSQDTGSALPPPPYGDGLWWDIHAYNVEIPEHGLHAGQMAPGTNIPNWVGLDDTTAPIDPSRIPKWDGNIPPGVPVGSVPFYSTNGSLSWLGPDGHVRSTAGYVKDTVFVHGVARILDLSPSQVVQAARSIVEQAGRPLTIEELRGLSVEYTGEPQNPYPLVFETEAARREQAALALRNSPYGFSRGKIVPGTNLPAWMDWQTPTGATQLADLPPWDGRIPPGVPAGSIPFYSGSGHLQWLAPNGMIYASRGSIRDTVAVHAMARRNNLSVSEFVAAMQAAVAMAGRPLTRGEMYTGGARTGGASLDTVA
jgi:hypothetical protein